MESREEHESFGVLNISRAQVSGNIPLFGSSIEHHNVIMIEVKTAYRDRHLHADWIHSDKLLLRATMSPSQFADAIISLNAGTGTPITLEFVRGDEKMRADPPRPQKHQQFREELRETLTQTLNLTDELIAETKGRLRRKAEQVRQHLASNMPFVETQFARQMDKTVNEAKAEIEAFATARERATGALALQGQEPELHHPSLPEPRDGDEDQQK